MALNFNKRICVNLDEPVTVTELEAVKDNALQQNTDTFDDVLVESIDKKRFDDKVKFAADFRKNSSLKCKRRTKRKKKKQELEKKKKEQLAREQAVRNGKVRKYTKEMRNRDEIEDAARDLRVAAIKTATLEDDKLVKAAMQPGRRFDNLIYGTATSDVEDKFEDLFDNVNDDTGNID